MDIVDTGHFFFTQCTSLQMRPIPTPWTPHTHPIHLTDEQIKSIGITFNSDVAQYVNVT